MASDIAQASLPHDVAADAPMGQQEIEPPVSNGQPSHDDTMFAHDKPNQSAFDGNADLRSTETTLNLKEASAHPNPNPAGPTPVDDVSAGIAPISHFLPKNAPNLSHLTPPPEQHLLDGAADVDTEMQDEHAKTQTFAPADPSTTQAPEAADLKVEGSLANGISHPVAPVFEAPAAAVDAPAPVNESPSISASLDALAPESSVQSLVRPREEDGEDEPAAKRSKLEESEPDFKMPEPSSAEPVVSEPRPVPTEAVQSGPVQKMDAPVDVHSSVEQPLVGAAVPVAETVIYDSAPMTPAQKSYLLDKMKNTKKTKHASVFLHPVDPVALNIPSYPEVIKEPMDLGTMETKLKGNQYSTVQDFANDFNLIVSNARKFNGDQHVVAQAAMNMEAYFRLFMKSVPGSEQAVPQKAAKKRSPSVSKAAPLRRESRTVAAAASPLQNEAFALQADGTPQIRRDSTINRPARAIKPPQNREISYSKPKRKEHQLELKFCEHVLDEIRKPQYSRTNHVFLAPVDPVALNIPQYRQIIKHPMDLSTMAQKLKTGEYGKASEFLKDLNLMVDNCLLFNPPGNPVRDLGIQFRRDFERVWQTKSKWEYQNKPTSRRASSGSNDESAADESEEEDDEPVDVAQATIAALSQQLAEMQNRLAVFKQKPAKAKKSKDKKGPSKKLGSLSSAPAKHSRPAAKQKKPVKPRPVTYDDKQEISQAVEKMNARQVEDLTAIIQKNCPAYANMGDDMELEIDDLPANVQSMLLDHVRTIFGNPNKKKAKAAAARDYSPDDVAAADDDDFEPERGGPKGGVAAGKRKKHKPMGRKEQQESINSLKSQLAAFNPNATSGSESPTTAASFPQSNAQAQSSGDEDSEESEEE